jgi:hypothetical protein
MFKSYSSKPVTRDACRIVDGVPLSKVDGIESTWQYQPANIDAIQFKAYETPQVGDWIVRLTAEDTYHVTDKVFRERNIVPPELLYREAPNTAHNGDSNANYWGKTNWQRKPDEPNFKCSYCGSADPYDVWASIVSGAKLVASDMKYGWPHKFYVEGGPEGVKKFYTLHLKDADPQHAEIIQQAMGMRFHFHADSVEWEPYKTPAEVEASTPYVAQDNPKPADKLH